MEEDPHEHPNALYADFLNEQTKKNKEHCLKQTLAHALVCTVCP